MEALNSIKRHSKIKINKFGGGLERLHNCSTFSKSIPVLWCKQLSEKAEIKLVPCWTHSIVFLCWFGFSSEDFLCNTENTELGTEREEWERLKTRIGNLINYWEQENKCSCK